jgi:hypothetical protein
LIPGFFSDCVVALGTPGEGGAGPTWIGSAFFYGRPNGVDEEDGRMRYAVYLVSNKHVFGELQQVVIRANPKSTDATATVRDYNVDLRRPDGTGGTEPAWIAHPDPDVDVGVIRVNFNVLQDEGMQASFFGGDVHALRSAELLANGVTEGDLGYVLGFPMGFVGDHRSVVIVRNGNIARIRDVLAGTEKSFLFDATVFPGNSGGPVVLRPEMLSIEGTQAISRASLIGIVRAYVPYQDIAISVQTNRPRVIFEENSGLAAVHPVDNIDACIELDPTPQQTTLEDEATTPPLEEAGTQDASADEAVAS